MISTPKDIVSDKKTGRPSKSDRTSKQNIEAMGRDILYKLLIKIDKEVKNMSPSDAVQAFGKIASIVLPEEADTSELYSIDVRIQKLAERKLKANITQEKQQQ